jgi:Arc/MetJ-type ribon-helix-helix transcriptional regulator
MNVRLTGELEQIIREKVESGEFASAEAVIAASLRQFGNSPSLRDPMAGADQRLANVKALFDEADRNPPPRTTPLPDDAFDRGEIGDRSAMRSSTGRST